MNCPKCGAEPNGDSNPYGDWKCASFTLTDGGFHQTQTCRIRELEAANAKLQRYKAAWDWCCGTWSSLEAVETVMKEATDAAKTS